MQERGSLGDSVSEDLVGRRDVMGTSGATLTLPAVRSYFNRTGFTGTQNLAGVPVLLLDPILFLDEYGLAFVSVVSFG